MNEIAAKFCLPIPRMMPVMMIYMLSMNTVSMNTGNIMFRVLRMSAYEEKILINALRLTERVTSSSKNWVTARVIPMMAKRLAYLTLPSPI